MTIPNSVITIDAGAFRFCSGLTSVNIGNSVTEIGSSAFNGCTGLTSVNINDIATWCRISFMSDDANPLFCAHHLYLNGSEVIDLVIPSSVTSIGFAVFTNLTDLNSVTIPSSVTSIGNSAFRGCTGLTSVNIPNSVTSIGYNAFDNCCSLRSIAIPYSVTSIGQFAFLGCSGLNSITVEDGNSTYDSRDNCNAIIETASNVLINGCHNTIIPNSVTTIERYAFANCDALTNIAIPNSVTSIGQNAFFGCSGLTCITIPNSITEIGSYAFQECSALETLNYNAINCADDGLTENGSPFYNLNISTINIGDGVLKIPAFFACGLSKMTSVTIPNSVINIGKRAFYHCEILSDITCLAETPPVISEENCFYPSYTFATLHVPAQSVELYKSTPYWIRFLNIRGDAAEGGSSVDPDYLKCDVNGDGEVNIADVNRVIDAILNH